MNDDDFGFSHLDKDVLSENAIVQENRDLKKHVKVLKKSLREYENQIFPFLEKLMGNPDQDMIKWPYEKRKTVIDDFTKKLNRISNTALLGYKISSNKEDSGDIMDQIYDQ